MRFIKEYKSVICMLLIAIFIFTFSTVVTSATIDDMDSFKELEKNDNTSEENGTGDIKVIEGNKNTTKNEEGENNDIKSPQEQNNIKENVKQENQNTSTNSLSDAGIEDTPIVLIIALFAISSVYAYIKTKNY